MHGGGKNLAGVSTPQPPSTRTLNITALLHSALMLFITDVTVSIANSFTAILHFYLAY